MMKQTERTMKDTVASDEAKLPPEAQDRIHKAVQRWRAELSCSAGVRSYYASGSFARGRHAGAPTPARPTRISASSASRFSSTKMSATPSTRCMKRSFYGGLRPMAREPAPTLLRTAKIESL